MKTVFTQDWIDWINTNVAQGQDKNGLFKILLDQGYEYSAIVKQMNFQPTIPVEQLVNPFDKATVQQQNPKSNTASSQIDLAKELPVFLPNASKFISEELELYAIEDFLNQQECEKIVALIQSKLRPSELTTAEADKSYRTSRTCDLGRLNDTFMAEIDQRICNMIGIDESYSEVVQGQYYEEGQQFKAHTDFFEAHEIDEYGGKMGQRTYTFMIYLNDVEEGGETNFVNVNEPVKPKRGMAVIWNSLYNSGMPNSNSMHHGMPVIKGYKAIITKWFRINSRQTPPPPMLCKTENEFVQNFTKLGFKKASIPPELFNKITQFYQDNKSEIIDEHVPGDFIVNSGKNKQSSALVELTDALRTEIHDVMKPILEDWCGQKLAPSYVYGIRVYFDGAVLKMHRDRIETHIISAILNVDQQVNEDWPLMIEDNYYRKHRVMLKPGEMVFYEGARLIHGRPLPLNGKSFANIFCHFQPEGVK